MLAKNKVYFGLSGHKEGHQLFTPKGGFKCFSEKIKSCNKRGWLFLWVILFQGNKIDIFSGQKLA